MLRIPLNGIRFELKIIQFLQPCPLVRREDAVGLALLGHHLLLLQ